MTTQPKRLTAEEEAKQITDQMWCGTINNGIERLMQSIAASLRRRDELYAKAWEECEEWRRLAGHRCSRTKDWRYRFPSGEYEYVIEANDHDAARKAAGLEDA